MSIDETTLEKIEEIPWSLAHAQDRQLEVAERLGYLDDINKMYVDHDAIHYALTGWLGIPCLCIGVNPATDRFAALEESAVLAVQRLMRAYRAEVPK